MRGQTNAMRPPTDLSNYVTLNSNQMITSLKTFLFDDRLRVKSPIQDLSITPSETVYKLGWLLMDKNDREAGSLFHQIEPSGGTSSMILLCGQQNNNNVHIEGRLWLNVGRNGTVDLLLQGPNGTRTIASI